MHPSSLHYFPLAIPFLLALFIGLILLVVLIELKVLSYAYERIGINRRHVFAVLLLSLVGSYVNIPVAELPGEEIESDRVVTFFGVQYVVPGKVHESRTIIAVNVGGAVIPTLLSIYLLVKNQLYVRGLIAVAIVTVIVHMLAKPVPRLGISVPVFVPPLVAAGVALILSWHNAPPLAYIAGSLGTLIGADLLNLDQIRGLGAPVASIGGAGTFDGIFVTGILAVLLAPSWGRPRSPQASEVERFA
jgi:uncharacterized membrane protein